MMELKKPNTENRKAEKPTDRIEGTNIFLDGQSELPKKPLIVLED